MMRARRERRANPDAGLTLVEVLVSTMIFMIIVTMITASIITMLNQGRKQTGQTNDLDSARTVIEMLDHQVRYANAISTPGTGTDGSYYVEFRTGYTDQQQTCSQWRYVPTGGLIQRRNWLPPITGVGSVTATAWATVGSGFSLVNATPIWSITPQSTADTHYQLAVTFNVSSGTPAVTSASQVTIAGINTVRNPLSPTPPTVCTEVGRP